MSNQTGVDEPQVGINGNVGFSMNGGRTEYNAWELDGGDNMDNGSNGTLNVYPSIDAIAEFKVLTSNYGAQYGRNGSGTVEVETKVGTKSFHGDAYEFVRNDAFNAQNYFNNTGFGGIGRCSAVQEERLRLYHWRPGLIPGRVQQGQAEDILLLVAGMAARTRAGKFNTVVPYSAERSGELQRSVLPTPGPDCPIDPENGLPFRRNRTLPVDPAAAALFR